MAAMDTAKLTTLERMCVSSSQTGIDGRNCEPKAAGRQ
jgi:hypothetical protein